MTVKLHNLDPKTPNKVVPLNFDDPQFTHMLADLQGNILKGHGRDHTVHMFLQFKKNPDATKAWIAEFSRKITSATQQRKEASRRKKTKKPWKETTFISLFFSASGYQHLGFAKNQIPLDRQFRKGMKPSGHSLNDPTPKTWETPYQNEIHAMILLANSDLRLLTTEESNLLRSITESPHALEVIHIERGGVIRNEHGNPIEHFGYVDGRSQPLFIKEDVETQQRREGDDQYDPATPLSAVLVKDPNSGKDRQGYGSYFVFRKLEQNVQGFKNAEAHLAEVLKLEGEDAERAGALVVGRFEDGSPVTLQSGEGMHNPVFNNFNYGNDQDGGKCPLHGHIRKVNPRGESAKDKLEERKHRIARRGIIYGKRKIDLSDQPEKGVGLLFMCFQADIAKQFEHVQKMANATTGGLDPIIGQTRNKKTSLQQQWPSDWASEDRKTKAFNFQGFVTLKGGEYFFAPNIKCLRNFGGSKKPKFERQSNRKPKNLKI